MESRPVYTVLAFLTFALAVTSAATEEFKGAQEKTYGPSPAYDPVPEATPSPPTTPACPPPPPPAAPGSCSFWSKKKPSSLPDLLSFITPILEIFTSGAGTDVIAAITSIFGSKTTLHQGLTSTRPDAYGELLRQGSAAVLNSYTSRQFPFTPIQVKANFQSALGSQQAAAAMASKFENANLVYGARN